MSSNRRLRLPRPTKVRGQAPTVTITGTIFTSDETVKFGTTAATSVTFVSATKRKAVSPAHAMGSVDIRMTNVGGVSGAVAGDKFTST